MQAVGSVVSVMMAWRVEDATLAEEVGHSIYKYKEGGMSAAGFDCAGEDIGNGMFGHSDDAWCSRHTG